MEFLPKNTVPARVTHCEFIALQKLYSDLCLKHFCKFPNNISFSFLLQKKQTHTVCNNRPNMGVDKTWARAHGLPYGLPTGLPYFDDFIISHRSQQFLSI